MCFLHFKTSLQNSFLTCMHYLHWATFKITTFYSLRVLLHFKTSFFSSHVSLTLRIWTVPWQSSKRTFRWKDSAATERRYSYSVSAEYWTIITLFWAQSWEFKPGWSQSTCSNKFSRELFPEWIGDEEEVEWIRESWEAPWGTWGREQQPSEWKGNNISLWLIRWVRLCTKLIRRSWRFHAGDRSRDFEWEADERVHGSIIVHTISEIQGLTYRPSAR